MPPRRRSAAPSKSPRSVRPGQKPVGSRKHARAAVPDGRGASGHRRPETADVVSPDGLSQIPEKAAGDSAVGIRLQKFLATAGVDSRRNCEDFIRQGRVTVDGQVVIDPAEHVDPERQDVRLDGERLRMPRFRYYLLNKPRGVLCTNSDPQGRPRAIDLVPSQGRRLFTVGRLDESTEGLLLVTNDGDLAERLAHPRFEVVRRYRCHVAGVPDESTLQQLRDGMYFSDGFFRFRGVRVMKRKGRSVILELELREGKNREIRRLLAKVGHKVISLERIAFGPLRLGYLSPGKCRELRPAEVVELRRSLDEMERSGRDLDSNRRPRRRPTEAADVAPPRAAAAAGSANTKSPRSPRSAISPRTDRTSAAAPASARSEAAGDRSPSPSRRPSGGNSGGTRRPGKGPKKKSAQKQRPINKGRDRRRP